MLKNAKRENWCQCHLADQQIPQLLEKVDADVAEKVRQGGCLHCSGKLHSAKYRRKPRGQPKQDWERDQEVYRASFCCDQDGCRKRHTPPSVRFLGRKVYWGFVVVLVAAMQHGITPPRLHALREGLGVARRTVEHWREWWLHTFVQSPFWKEARARFLPPIVLKTLPLSFCEALMWRAAGPVAGFAPISFPDHHRRPWRWLCEEAFSRRGCRATPDGGMV